ncbi:MFS transporter [Anaerobacillus isosaccharinicus]|uniref:MFS transporter n=1 Tax=Anaerobacillus isosaccharinicus TaxID=1532552 RepID=A0A1S2LR24_9BACI|nr:MFS transporter [Anaerobacillus isosaccharinicus]MBA5585533.1 MFS transporter [Anaerobacillus isosaccharinicus]QOY36153.1 MFS transporter [Anaerobacillus isosaccharinicus]
MKNKSSLLILIIGLLPFVMVLGNSMLIPILPTMEEELNISAFEVGFLLSVFSIVAALVIPIVGFLSDRFGRKKIILISLLFVMGGSVVTIIAGRGVAEPFHWILAGRVIQGIGAGGTAPLAMALVGDLFSGNERSKNLGALEVFNGIGKVVSPFIGALAALLFWYSAFYVYFIVSLIAFLGIYFSIKPIVQEKYNEPLSSYAKMLWKVLKREARWLFPLSFLGAMALFILFGLLVFLSFEIERIYAIDGVFKGIVFTFPLGALTVVSYWTGKRIGDNHDYMKRLISTGSGIILGAFVFLMVFSHLSGLIFGLTLIATGVGLILPCINTLITSSVGGKERGLIVSLYGMIRFLGVAFGPIFFALWMVEVIDMFVKAFLLFLFTSIWVMTALKIKLQVFKQVFKEGISRK